MTGKILSPKAAQWFEKRGINPETATRYNVFTGSRESESGSVSPDPNGNILVFPFIDGGRDVAEKYRTHPKTFWQRTGGKKTFWNADVLDDPALHDGRNALVITEGEIDALTVLDCGYGCFASRYISQNRLFHDADYEDAIVSARFWGCLGSVGAAVDFACGYRFNTRRGARNVN